MLLPISTGNTVGSNLVRAFHLQYAHRMEPELSDKSASGSPIFQKVEQLLATGLDSLQGAMGLRGELLSLPARGPLRSSRFIA